MSNPEQHFIEAEDGTSIAWYDYGGVGPTMVLGHATGFCGRIWDPVVPYLLPHLRCISYDLRGHGASNSPEDRPEGFAWDRYAEDLLAVLDDAGVSKPYSFGHSCGGATAILAELARPNTFTSMFLFEPVIFAAHPPIGPDPGRDLAVRTRNRQSTFTSAQEAMTKFSTKGPFASLDTAALRAYVDYGFVHSPDGRLELACPPDDEAEVYVMASAHGAYSRLGEVTCPVTIAHGGKSSSFSADEMRHLVGQLPTGKYMEFEDLGHFGPLEQPKNLAHEVLVTLEISR